LEEQVIVVKITPGQLLVYACCMSCNSDNVQIIAKANSPARSHYLLNKLPFLILAINTECDRSGLLQGEPDGDGSRLYTPEHGTGENERQVRKSLS
jgi:hypothetical protein